MQKLINEEWADCTQEDLVDGDRYRVQVGGTGWQEQTYKTPAPVLPVVELSNISIPAADLQGSIYWIAKDAPLVITADCPLPDGDLMVMVERVIDGSDTVDDIRTKAVISDGVMTLSFIFDTSGNYIFRESRLNEGLVRIGGGFQLSFDDIEFDVFVVYP